MIDFSTRSANGMMRTGARLGLVGIGILALLLSGGATYGAGTSDKEMVQPIQIPTTGMKSGRLTAKSDNSAAINGTSYAFHPNVIFGDDEREPVQWSDFKKGDQVQFHLKQERIDYLILVKPK